MHLLSLLILSILASVSVSITEPVEGETYSGNWLTLHALVCNDSEIPDSVHFALNGATVSQIPRLNTDWYTYMANDLHTGYSMSPAPLDNTIMWTAPVTGDTHEFCSPVVVQGMVYFVSDQQSTAYALDAATGDVIWQYDVVDHVDDAVTWYQERVYVAADSAWCLDAVSGQRIWAFKPASYFKMNGTPALGEGVAYFSFAPDWGSLEIYALDALNGSVIWVSPIPFYSTGCITLSGNILYVPTYLGGLYAMDISDGSVVWENSDSQTGYWDSSPVVVDGVIYICGNDGIARGINAQSGETIWSSDISSGGQYIAATPAFAYGSMFFADQVDSFHRLNGDDGTSIWSVYGVQHGSPGIADSTVFFGEGADRANGKVRALSAVTGEEVWSYQTGGEEIYSSPAITDGVLFIAGMDWNLYAFGTEAKYTYLDDLFPDIGPNTLIVTSFNSGAPVAADTVSFTVTGSGIEILPTKMFALSVSPTPFTSNASISFELPAYGHTQVTIHDLSGRLVHNVYSGDLQAGSHSFVWNGSCSSGSSPSGLYLCTLRFLNATETTGLCLLR